MAGKKRKAAAVEEPATAVAPFVATRPGEIADLMKRVAELERSLRGLERQRELERQQDVEVVARAARAEKAEMAEKIAKSCFLHERSKAEKMEQDYHDKIVDLTRTAEAKVEEARKAREINATLTTELDQHKAQAISAENRIEALQKQQESLEEVNSQFRKDLEDQKKATKSADGLLDTAYADLNAKEAARKAATHARDRAEAQHKEAELKLADLQDQYNAARATIKTLESQTEFEDLQREYFTLEEELETLRSSFIKRDHEVTVKDARIARLEIDLQKALERSLSAEAAAAAKVAPTEGSPIFAATADDNLAAELADVSDSEFDNASIFELEFEPIITVASTAPIEPQRPSPSVENESVTQVDASVQTAPQHGASAIGTQTSPAAAPVIADVVEIAQIAPIALPETSPAASLAIADITEIAQITPIASPETAPVAPPTIAEIAEIAQTIPVASPPEIAAAAPTIANITEIAQITPIASPEAAPIALPVIAEVTEIAQITPIASPPPTIAAMAEIAHITPVTSPETIAVAPTIAEIVEIAHITPVASPPETVAAAALPTIARIAEITRITPIASAAQTETPMQTDAPVQTEVPAQTNIHNASVQTEHPSAFAPTVTIAPPIYKKSLGLNLASLLLLLFTMVSVYLWLDRQALLSANGHGYYSQYRRLSGAFVEGRYLFGVIPVGFDIGQSTFTERVARATATLITNFERLADISPTPLY